MENQQLKEKASLRFKEGETIADTHENIVFVFNLERDFMEVTVGDESQTRYRLANTDEKEQLEIALIINPDIKTVPIAGFDNTDGRSIEAILNNQQNPEAKKEEAVEVIYKMLQSIVEGKDIVPFILGVENGKPIAQRCEVNEQGILVLPEMKLQTASDIKKKQTVVTRILEKIKPVLHADIDNVTFIALMRKDEEKLRKVMEALKKKKGKASLKNRVGCIWLVIETEDGTEEFLL
jgi:hypothetical protein